MSILMRVPFTFCILILPVFCWLFPTSLRAETPAESFLFQNLKYEGIKKDSIPKEFLGEFKLYDENNLDKVLGTIKIDESGPFLSSKVLFHGKQKRESKLSRSSWSYDYRVENNQILISVGEVITTLFSVGWTEYLIKIEFHKKSSSYSWKNNTLHGQFKATRLMNPKDLFQGKKQKPVRRIDP